MARKDYSRADVLLLGRVVRFAHDPIAVALSTPRKVESVRRLLTDLLSHSWGFVVFGDARALTTELPIEAITHLHAELRTFFNTLTSTATSGHGGQMPETTIAMKFSLAAVGHVVMTAIDGPPRDVIWFQLLALVRAIGASRLRQCPDPACRRVFLRTGKQEACSTRCRKRLYMRQYRKA
jgi:hypothetical protein